MSPQEFKAQLIDESLNLICNQWSELGVAIQAGPNPCTSNVDIEALLLLTTTVGRYDQRIFDEVLSWLSLYGSLINVARLRFILKKFSYGSERILLAMLESASCAKAKIKWGPLKSDDQTSAEPLFFLKGGVGCPVLGEMDPIFLRCGFQRNVLVNRKMTQCFNPLLISGLQLRMRQLFGIGTRSEVMSYLILNKQGTISEFSKISGYARQPISRAMDSLASTGLAEVSIASRQKVYRLKNEFANFLAPKNIGPFIKWTSLFWLIDSVLKLLNNERFDSLSPSGKMSRLKHSLGLELCSEINCDFPDCNFGLDSHVWDEFCYSFISDLKNIPKR